jgi:hypothetical protein
MDKKTDWYPTTVEGKRTLYRNIDVKINGYRGKYLFLTDDYRAGIQRMRQTCIEGVDKIRFSTYTVGLKQQLRLFYWRLNQAQNT